MSYPGMPTSVRRLEQRIRNLEGSDGLAQCRRVGVGLAVVVVGQLLPEGAITGGSAMALRYGRGTRFTSMRREPNHWRGSAATSRTL